MEEEDIDEILKVLEQCVDRKLEPLKNPFGTISKQLEKEPWCSYGSKKSTSSSPYKWLDDKEAKELEFFLSALIVQEEEVHEAVQDVEPVVDESDSNRYKLCPESPVFKVVPLVPEVSVEEIEVPSLISVVEIKPSDRLMCEGEGDGIELNLGSLDESKSEQVLTSKLESGPDLSSSYAIMESLNVCQHHCHDFIESYIEEALTLRRDIPVTRFELFLCICFVERKGAGLSMNKTSLLSPLQWAQCDIETNVKMDGVFARLVFDPGGFMDCCYSFTLQDSRPNLFKRGSLMQEH